MTTANILEAAGVPRQSRDGTGPFAASALHYTEELGWPVFPVQEAGKQPATPNGLKDASSHPEAIGNWMDCNPRANVGVATGVASGTAVLDVDGEAGLMALSAFGEMPRTARADTGRGFHLYFRHTGGRIPNSAGKLGPGLDVRGDGGYIIAPPSVHPSGRVYQWADGLSPWEVEPAPFPAAFLERLTRDAPAAVPPVSDVSRPAGHAILTLLRSSRSVQDAAAQADRRVQAYLAKVGYRGVGARNQTAFQVAAWLLRDFGLPERSAFAYLEAWNDGNRPPLARKELVAVFQSARQNGKRAAGCAYAGRGSAA